MTSFSPRPLHLTALLLSTAINLALLGALSVSLTTPAAPALAVFQLPAVSVHGKRLSNTETQMASTCTCESPAATHGTQL
jgi:hypothetical protein